MEIQNNNWNVIASRTNKRNDRFREIVNGENNDELVVILSDYNRADKFFKEVVQSNDTKAFNLILDVNSRKLSWRKMFNHLVKCDNFEMVEIILSRGYSYIKRGDVGILQCETRDNSYDMIEVLSKHTSFYDIRLCLSDVLVKLEEKEAFYVIESIKKGCPKCTNMKYPLIITSGNNKTIHRMVNELGFNPSCFLFDTLDTLKSNSVMAISAIQCVFMLRFLLKKGARQYTRVGERCFIQELKSVAIDYPEIQELLCEINHGKFVIR